VARLRVTIGGLAGAPTGLGVINAWLFLVHA